MMCDICQICDGTGFRNVFEGSKCHSCNGTGIVPDEDPDDWHEDDDYVSPEEQKRQDDMERGNYLRDRAKDERADDDRTPDKSDARRGIPSR